MSSIDGLLLVDKPVGLTSHDVVHRVRKILGLQAIGHAGTLDPLASGLLLLLLGQATKISDYLLNEDKGYEFKVRLGCKTDSMDITGKVLRKEAVDLAPETIRAAAESLTGILNLQVPVHSAVKVDGKRLYEFAHQGEAPSSLPWREMKFYDLKILELGGDFVSIACRCSKGSYIRAWANQLGEVLEVGGCIETLRRTVSEPFHVTEALSLEELQERWQARQTRNGSELGPAWIPLTEALPHFRRVDVAGQDERLLQNGQISSALKMRLLPLMPPGHSEFPPVRVIAQESNDLLALLTAEQGEFYRIKRVFPRA